MEPVKGGGANDERFWEQALKVFGKKLEVIASNIANADTPNYKARDIDFKAAMAQAMAKGEGGGPVAGVFPANRLNENLFPLLYRTPAQGSVDNNTVEMDLERAAFADTAIRYEMTVQKVAHEYKEMDDLFKGTPY